MQLYKSRGFSEYFQDTFSFLKLNGKHFFKHFFIVNGIFLIILMVLGYFFTKFYTELMFGGILNQGNNPNVFDDYINENGALFFLFAFLFLVVGLVAGIISYSYTPIYLKLYSNKNGKNFGTKEIVNVYKSNIGKLFIFLIISVFVGLLLLIPTGIIMFVLAITIIGIMLLPVVLGAYMLFFSCTLMEYLEDKKGLMDSYGYSWKLMTSKFWAAIGSVGLFYFMSYVVQNVITIIPYIFGMASFFTTIEGGSQPDAEEVSSFMTIMMLLVFFLSFVLGTILNNIVLLNQGVIFYSLKEENENINTKSEIDLIGSGE